jgi:phospholipid-binding lipoprotein MlaA
MRSWRTRAGGLAAGCALAGIAGCASVPPDAGKNPADPWERMNRQVFDFNDRLDRALIKPAAQAYTTVVPRPVRSCVGNVFANLGEVTNITNALLQGKPTDAAVDTCRLVLNSTIGVLGCFDVANSMGLERNKQDFGLTLGKWGFQPGAYLVIPLLGPSTVRDALGEIPDYWTDPVSYITPTRDRYLTEAGYAVDRRSQLLDATKLVDEIALDKYVFTRDAYLQRRRNRVYDGNPPPLEEDDTDGAAATPAGSGPDAAPGIKKKPVQPGQEQSR